ANGETACGGVSHGARRPEAPDLCQPARPLAAVTDCDARAIAADGEPHRLWETAAWMDAAQFSGSFSDSAALGRAVCSRYLDDCHRRPLDHLSGGKARPSPVDHRGTWRDYCDS